MKKHFFLLFLLCFSIASQAIVITGLTCETVESPLAVATHHPRFSWQMTSDENGAMQTSYEIEIVSMENGARQQVWNSGKVASTQSQLISYNGKPLSPVVRYLWRVRVWDEQDRVSPWSSENEFRLAPELKFLNAKWIGAIRSDSAHIPAGVRFPTSEMRTPQYNEIWKNINTLSQKSIYLRKPFYAEKQITDATAYVCGLGHYEFSLNGVKVGDAEFAPFWSDYDKTVYYNTFNITGLLKKGENVAGILLGNGFYNQQGGRYSKLKVSFGAPTLFIKMIINYSDGTSQEIISDKTWKYSLSPITFNSIYGGEDYDARLEQKGWNMLGFNDQDWKPVVLQDAPKGKLTPQLAAPVKIMEYYSVKSREKLTAAECDSASLKTKRKIDPSAFVLDMGQNLAGFPEITVRGKKGDKITLVVAEALTPEGATNQNQTGRQHYYQYTLRGEGDETWHPQFAYYGFRYIQVEGAVMKGDKNPKKLPLLKNIKSCFVYNSATPTSTFESSNDIFNKAHILIQKAVESNMQAIFTDCPHREKLGWLEEVHLNGPGLMYNFNLAAFLPKIMQDMADAQLPNGIVPTIAPLYNIFGNDKGFDEFGDSPEWGSTLNIMPWMYFDFYGDSTLIVNYYQNMRRYVDYLTTRANNHILAYGLGDWYDYGNFRAGFSRNTPLPLVATDYYYYDLTLLVKAAKMVGNKFDETYYQELAERVRRAINTMYFNTQTNQYGTGSQTANAMAVYMNIVDRENRQAVLNNLVKDIKAHGNRLTTGDIGNRYLFQTLATNGLNDLMYTMQNHYDAPGYGFQLKFGATTLTEQWDPRMGSSWNHFMMGQIDEWFFGSLAGIQTKTTAPGFQQLVIRPEVVGDLKFVRSSYETLYGKVSVDWKRDGDNFTLKVSIPVNCTADVYLPGEKEPKRVKSGNYAFSEILKQNNN
ncbi:MAG: glycoside hydrolase family 78 protein [Paludibacter sp.]|nr:glycoside hydrolase family 78 protein [Paludibacter sp.]